MTGTKFAGTKTGPVAHFDRSCNVTGTGTIPVLKKDQLIEREEVSRTFNFF